MRLQRDGRIANVDLADAISLSPSACLRRVKALEATGIIDGYRAEISRPSQARIEAGPASAAARPGNSSRPGPRSAPM